MSATHIAGTPVTVNNRQRQRCAWCGHILIDYDLANIAVPVGQEGEPGTWEVGALVHVDGGLSYVIEQPTDERLPGDSCAVA